MQLTHLTDRVWYYPFEQKRDRPSLGYIRGDHWSLAVDAGHSAAHIAEFYQAIEAAGMPFPSVTVLTHWHWDHTFAMHAVNGVTVANDRTNQYLTEYMQLLEKEGIEPFLALDESVRIEYADHQPVIVVPADIIFQEGLSLDAGNCPIKLLTTESPHTVDSTLVHIVNEKVLFLGDAAGGTFPTWEKDAVLCGKLAQTISSVDCDVCVESHWNPKTKTEMIRELLQACR